MKQIKAAIPFLLIVVIALILVFVWRSGSSSTSTQSPSGAAPRWGVQTKTSGCVARGGLQDSACTPGAIFSNVTKTQVCTPGYASSVRDVPQSVKNKVYAEYGITRRLPGQYEVDHLVSLQLGGSNDIANLWPEAASPTPGFHEKDKVENYLNSQICSGAISLQQAQIEIATNWLAVYNRMPKKALANNEMILFRQATGAWRLKIAARGAAAPPSLPAWASPHPRRPGVSVSGRAGGLCGAASRREFTRQPRCPG